MLNNREKGDLGENVACEFIKRRGYSVISRNYRKKWGEIDIIAQKDDVLNFFEVKSVTKSLEVNSLKGYRPEENVNTFKLGQIRRMVRTFLAESAFHAETEFRFHVLSVYLDMKTRKGRVKWIKDVIL